MLFCSAKLFLQEKKLDNEDPYASLKKDILQFSTMGDIILVGGFNAKTVSNQSLQLIDSEKVTNNPLWLEEGSDRL